MPETAYLHVNTTSKRLDHAYGPAVRVLSDPWSLSVAARLSHPDCRTPELHRLIESGYRRLFQAAAETLPTTEVMQPTRMTSLHPEVRWTGRIIDRSAPVVVVDVARAGMVPAYIMQQALHEVVEPEGVRVDHVFMQRVSDESGRVTGVDTSGSKIGGPVAGSTVFIPDPMAATGSSISEVLRMYRELDGGPPERFVLCHLIVTPEYLRRITGQFPEAVIYTLRVDRGRSAVDVASTRMGSNPEGESGLDGRDYIVPGAGGLGELINNTPQ